MQRNYLFYTLALLLPLAALADGLWRITALDPQTLVLQGDYSQQEQESFRMTPEEQKLTGWKYDNAFWATAKRAIAHRPDTEAKLQEGPYLANGLPVADFGFWKYPTGLARFPDNLGRPKPGDVAEIQYIVYVKLAEPLTAGAKLNWQLPTGEKVDWTYEPTKVPTPLIKVNQVGYAPRQGKKFAYLGLWLGPKLGAYKPKEGLTFDLIYDTTGEVVKSGPVSYRAPDRENKGTFFCGEQTLEMDFSDVTKQGRYFIRIKGIGRSRSFLIDDSAIGAAFATHMKGLFHQRCGCAKPASLTHWTDDPCHQDVVRGIQPPEEWEYSWCFTDASGARAKITHFPVITAMLPSYKEHLHLPGGWHDAADYDRRPLHLRIVGELATLYLLRPEAFTDGQLLIPEGRNGIPDILDEAGWGLQHLLAGQQKDGGVGTWIEAGRHPDARNFAVASKDPLKYALSRATRNSSRAYAGYAALYARALLKVGTSEAKRRAKVYTKSAIAAWKFSCGEPARRVEMRCGWQVKDERTVFYNEPEDIDPSETLKAAVNLFVLTGDRTYLSALKAIEKPFVQNFKKSGWSMSATRHAEFCFTEIDNPVYQELQRFWKQRMLSDADQMIEQEEGPKSFAYRVPWYSYDDWRVSSMSWGNCHPLRRAITLCLAHALTKDQKYLDAAFLANDFHNGCNPNGTTWTSGLGQVYPVRFLHLHSYNDGIAEYVQGITPYRNTYGLTPKAREWVWNNREEEYGCWPYWRRYGNVEEFSVAASEFTVWETISPAAFTTGYLMTPGAKVPPANRVPAQDIRQLPGFWALP